MILAGCKTPSGPEPVLVPLQKDIVADFVFGNHDHSATTEELAAVDRYFESNAEAWCICGVGELSAEAGGVSPADVRELLAAGAVRIFPDEQSLRKAYEGISIRTPWVSVCVLTADHQVFLTKLFRAPGANIATADWEELSFAN